MMAEVKQTTTATSNNAQRCNNSQRSRSVTGATAHEVSLITSPSCRNHRCFSMEGRIIGHTCSKIMPNTINNDINIANITFEYRVGL
jgi:hypothetical protein